MRAQARTEGATDERSEDAHLAFIQTKDFLHIRLAVLRALGLVVDMQGAVRLIQHGAGVGLHRVVVFDGRAVVHIEVDGSFGPFSLEVTAGPGRRLRRWVRLFLHGQQVGFKGFACVLDLHQRTGMPCQLKVVGDHQCQWLATIEHAVVIQRTKRRAVRRIGIGERVIVAGEFRPVEVIEHHDHTRQRQGFGGIDPDDPAFGDGAGDHAGVKQALAGKLTGIPCLTCDLKQTVNTVQGFTDSRHDRSPAMAASLRARMIARRANLTLKALCSSGSASCSKASAALLKVSRLTD